VADPQRPSRERHHDQSCGPRVLGGQRSWKYHSDGVTSSQSLSDTLQTWSAAGSQVSSAQNAVPMGRPR
jgi:hypothetical protein